MKHFDLVLWRIICYLSTFLQMFGLWGKGTALFSGDTARLGVLVKESYSVFLLHYLVISNLGLLRM